jgi:Nif-specific regulatory protein
MRKPMAPSNEQTDIANNSEFIAIQQTVQQIEHAHNPAFAIHNILSICSRLMGLNRGRVVLKDPQQANALVIAHAYGLTPEEMARSRFTLKEGITGKVMHSAQPVVIPDIDQEQDYLFRTVDRSTLPQEPVSFIAVPLIRNNICTGVLGFNRLRHRNRSFDRDVSFAKIIAVFIAEILAVKELIEQQTQSLKLENEQLRSVALGQGSQYGIIGESASLLQAIDKATRAATTPVTVMLKGESGTGKEKFSRMIHRASRRKDGPFIAINCAAIPKDLLEAELFGYEKGSFTGANQLKKGKFELADKGTLFLDEIGDLDFNLQAKLLRVLEEKSVSRIGGTKDIPLDVRIIVASHKDLHQAVNENRFRLDLFYRFNVFPIELPPLRDRHGDIRILARHFLDIANQDYQMNTVFERAALDFFEAYLWPGNIRQLENVIKRCVLMADENRIISIQTVQQILEDESAITHNAPSSIPQSSAFQKTQPTIVQDTNIRREDMADPPYLGEALHHEDQTRAYWKVSSDEKSALKDALKFSRGNKTRAAKLLNMTPRQFNYRLKKLGMA